MPYLAQTYPINHIFWDLNPFKNLIPVNRRIDCRCNPRQFLFYHRRDLGLCTVRRNLRKTRSELLSEEQRRNTNSITIMLPKSTVPLSFLLHAYSIQWRWFVASNSDCIFNSPQEKATETGGPIGGPRFQDYSWMP